MVVVGDGGGNWVVRFLVGCRFFGWVLDFRLLRIKGFNGPLVSSLIFHVAILKSTSQAWETDGPIWC